LRVFFSLGAAMTIRKHKGTPFDPRGLRRLIDEHDDGNMSKAARRIGISPPSLFVILTGQSTPRATTLARMARAYGVTQDWLYSGNARTADDTFVAGARFAITKLRKELDRLEESLVDRVTPLRSPSSSSPVEK
jgi:transcriptional regulator with XRE-family HTH domain